MLPAGSKEFSPNIAQWLRKPDIAALLTIRPAKPANNSVHDTRRGRRRYPFK